jgi:hypothetical protein
MACGHQFRAGKEVDADELWTKYMIYNRYIVSFCGVEYIKSLKTA